MVVSGLSEHLQVTEMIVLEANHSSKSLNQMEYEFIGNKIER